MDALESGGLSRRKRRAVALAAGAAIVIVVAGVAYLRGSSPATTPSAGPLTAHPGDATPDYVLYDFPSPTVAWALAFPGNRPGGFTISRTVDGAKHWQKRLTGDHSQNGSSPVLIQFFDEKHGFVATGDGQLRRTSDGGASWKSLSIPEPRYSYIRFRDERRGWQMAIPTGEVGQPAHLYATDDAGDSWQRLPDPPAGGWVFAFRRTSEAWLASGGLGSPRIYRSVDGGLSWQPRDIPIDNVPAAIGSWSTSVLLLPGDGVIASVSCACNVPVFPNQFNFTSFDGGATWRRLPPPPVPRGHPRFIAYQDDANWWTIDTTTLYRSSDAGQTWTTAADNLPDWQFQPRAVDKKRAWAQVTVPDGHGLATTVDAGAHWTRVTVPRST